MKRVSFEKETIGRGETFVYAVCDRNILGNHIDGN